MHSARLHPARWELVWRPAIWEELDRRGASLAIVPFYERAGIGGRTDTITLLRVIGEEQVVVERWTSRDEFCHALEAPLWERFGTLPDSQCFGGRSSGTPLTDRSCCAAGAGIDP